MVAILAALVAACAPGSAAAKPSGAGFELGKARVKPGTVYFDGEREAQVRFAFKARRRLDVVVRVVHADSGRGVRRYVGRNLAPGKFHQLTWDGRRANRGVPGDGSYEVRIGPPGHDGAAVGRFEFHDHVFPVAGSHTYGDQFGDPRSGGRVHEGQDLPAGCGTPLIAARGGRVAATGYSDALYGYYVLIDGTATDRDYFYAHLQAPDPAARRRSRQDGRPNRRGRQDRQRPHRVLPAALRALAARLPRRRPRGPGSRAAALGCLLLSG